MSFSISYSVDLQTSNTLSLHLSKISLFHPSFWRIVLMNTKFWIDNFFLTIKCSSIVFLPPLFLISHNNHYCFPICKVSFFPDCIWDFFFSFCFHSLTLTYLGVLFFVFILLSFHWVFWIYKFMPLASMVRFQVLFFQVFFFPIFSLFSCGTPIYMYFGHLILFGRFLRFCPFFLQSFSFLSFELISFTLSSSSLYFCLQNLSIKSSFKFF